MRNKRVKMRYRPSKAESIFTLIVGAIFVGIGIFVAIPTSGLFGVFWTFVVAGGVGLNAARMFGNKGYPTYEINVEDSNVSNIESIEERLRKLDLLYNQGLISKEELEARRKEILSEI